jgi:hypothetical protein
MYAALDPNFRISKKNRFKMCGCTPPTRRLKIPYLPINRKQSLLSVIHCYRASSGEFSHSVSICPRQLISRWRSVSLYPILFTILMYIAPAQLIEQFSLSQLTPRALYLAAFVPLPRFHFFFTHKHMFAHSFVRELRDSVRSQIINYLINFPNLKSRTFILYLAQQQPHPLPFSTWRSNSHTHPHSLLGAATATLLYFLEQQQPKYR